MGRFRSRVVLISAAAVLLGAAFGAAASPAALAAPRPVHLTASRPSGSAREAALARDYALARNPLLARDPALARSVMLRRAAALGGTRPGGGAGLASAQASQTTGQLYAVAAVSSGDVWAVGCGGDCNGAQTLILHWGGTRWSKVASPDPGAGVDELFAVTAVSADDVWAVGYQCGTPHCGGANDVIRSLILHWNGTKWSAVPSPDPSTVSNVLQGVTAVSASDVWAAGSEANPSTFLSDTMILHWNGTKWSRVPTPNVETLRQPESNLLYAISATSANDVWATGDWCDTPGCPYPGQVTTSLVLHWNGSEWSWVPAPDPGNQFENLLGATALTSANAWAVGVYAQNLALRHYALTLRWNGTAWSPVPGANPASGVNDLLAVSAASPGDIWAVGDQIGNGLPYLTLTEHWNGKAWSAVKSPNGTTSDVGINLLSGVAAVSPGDAVAVGWAEGSSVTSHVLILRWNGKSWSRM